MNARPERQVTELTVGDKEPGLRVTEFDRSREPSRRRRALLFLLALATAVLAWWLSGYLFAYTDDAYLTSDVVSITPEVTGPIEAVHVMDNEWVGRGTLLFTIDAVPFRLAVEQARAEEARSQAQLPVDQAQLQVLRAQKESADAAARFAAANLRRDTPLGQSGAISAQVLDQTRTTEEQSAAQQHAAEAALQKAEETLSLDRAAASSAHAARLLAEWRLSRTKVVAPVDGYVTHLAVQAGDMVSPSQAAVAVVDGKCLARRCELQGILSATPAYRRPRLDLARQPSLAYLPSARPGARARNQSSARKRDTGALCISNRELDSPGATDSSSIHAS